MDIKYVGWADVRILTSADVPPTFDDQGEVVEEEPWEYRWESKFGAVLPVDEAHTERVLAVGDFRQAQDDEVTKAIELLDANQHWEASEQMRQRRAQLMGLSESLVVSEADVTGITGDEKQTPDDQRPQLDDSNDDDGIDSVNPDGGGN